MKIDKAATTPLYSQVEVILEDKILTGAWDEGFQIPTENELANTYDVSNITVKRAVMNLVDKGLLIRQRGRGTFVTKLPQEKNIHKSEFIRMNEETISSHDLLTSKFQQTYPAIAKKLNLPPETKFVYLERIGYDAGENVSLEYTYIPQNIWPALEEPPNKDIFIYDVLKNTCGISLSRSKNYFSAAVANEKEMSLIGVRLNTPLFVWERITYSTTNEAVEYSKFVMKQDKEKYFVELDLT
ncbi:GntR family transcriptional regulator [Planococcus halocryophilus]|uniref:GntR family transcriptional regulator n=1 Tax=Planococcus halocryophilus TaxID=1215089 RepID=UPI001F0D1E79|nr:GntR family transcriptional regulator [Planococcus halocryophilus]MCH4825388.1 GntR family transcriptional regulator [Planococcus halocryophilus]